MPGYVVDQESHRNFVMADEATLDNIMDKAFWGLRFDPENGNLTAESVEDDTAVMAPQYEDITSDINEYATWFWTKKNISFSWNETRPGHLIMEVF